MILKRLRPALLAAFGIAPGIEAARAEVADGPAALPPITVRPSSYEDPGAEARARQERLVRKLDQSDYVLRHICTHCMGQPPAPIPAAPERPATAFTEAPAGEASAQP